MESNVRTKFISLSSSDDEDTNNDLPKIINTISLQGCSEISFGDGAKETDADDFLYPECEIKEEPHANESIDQKPEIKENGHVIEIKKEKKDKKEKKRIKLTHFSTVDHQAKEKPKASTSKKDDSSNVVDSRRLALQENLFKTKELFDTFLRVCQDQDSSPEMELVVQKQIRAYGQAKSEFLGSHEFQNILESETEKVNTSSTKPWLNLKLVLDSLKHNRKINGPKLKLGESEESQDAGKSNEDEPVIECPQKRRHLKKLEKCLRALNLKIKKLEERELDLDDLDNDDSAYIKLDRYRTQFTKCYKKICEFKGKLADADRPYLRRVSFAGTTYPHINRCIERYYNRHREFPDFQDIKKLIMVANEQEEIQMQPIKVHSMAEKAFKEFGEMLKRLRQYDDYDVIVSYLDEQVDPARHNPQLQEELTKNALLFRKKEQEVIDKFAAKLPGDDHEDNETSDSEPKKKKRKMMISSPQKKFSPSTSKHLSSSESSSDEDEEKDKNKPAKRKHPVPTLSSSSDDEEEKRIKKKPVEGKGKTLIGKKRIVKKGVKPTSPVNANRPKTSLSSEEESAPEDNKDNFASYLGLQGSTVKNEIKLEKRDEEGVACEQEIRRTLPDNNTNKSARIKTVLNSDSKENSAPTLFMEVIEVSNGINKSDKKPKMPSKISDTKIENNLSSESDTEPVLVMEKPTKSKKSSRTEDQSEQKPEHRPVLRKQSATSKSKPSWCSDSDDGEVSGDEESVNKSFSEAELSTGTKDLSSDSSDCEDAKSLKKDPDVDDSTIILSEDIPESRTVSVTTPASESDSDEVCYLSSTPEETRTVAPRRSKPKRATSPLSGRNPRRPVMSFGPPTPTKLTLSRTPPMTSTPKRSIRPVMITKSLSSKVDGSKKLNQSGLPNLSPNGGKQTTITQVINGASRKISAPRSQKTDQSVEVIQLD